MFRLSNLLLISLSSYLAASTVNASEEGGCADPLAAIMKTLDCVAAEDIPCASAGYNSDKFVKLHNTKDTNTQIDSGGQYWGGAFAMVDFTFSYDHQMSVGPNKASIRYIEGITFSDGSDYGFEPSTEYPWSFSFVQHEHALVTVDDDCKIQMWDQYGDDVEQNYHYDTSDVVFQILCDKKIYPLSVCKMFLKPKAGSEDEVAGSKEEAADPDFIEHEVEEEDENGNVVKKLLRKYIKNKADAIKEAHRILAEQFPQKKNEEL